jgi:hypothetical protein
MHSYYHLIPLVLSHCTVGYLSDSVGHSRYSLLNWVTDVGVFPRISSADEKHLVLLANVVSRFDTFSEAPCLAQKSGTYRSDNLVMAL